METAFNYTGPRGFFSSDEKKMINKILKLAEEYPEEVRIICMPDKNDGCIYCELPSNWLKIKPKIKRDLTDEQRAAASARLAKLRRKTS